MSGRVEVVESVGQYGNGFETLLQSVAMGCDVHAVGQTAHHQHPIAALLSQTGDEMAHGVLAVEGAMARAHDVDDAHLVEVGRTFIV